MLVLVLISVLMGILKIEMFIVFFFIGMIRLIFLFDEIVFGLVGWCFWCLLVLDKELLVNGLCWDEGVGEVNWCLIMCCLFFLGIGTNFYFLVLVFCLFEGVFLWWWLVCVLGIV